MRRIPAIGLMLGAWVVSPAVGRAETPAGPPDEAQSRGALLYRAHCASCHGAEGRGDGPVASELETAPADLTLLSADGEFPGERVMQAIDGRLEIGGHGSREMPIWGLTFLERGRTTDQEDEIAARLRDLTSFLRSIQRAD